MPRRRVYVRVGRYRSPFEARLAEFLDAAGVGYEYETLKLSYTVPAVKKIYRPDFILSNGIIIEAKGEWCAADRKKIQLVREQHPHLDIRMVFYNARAKIYKGSNTTYAQWADEHAIPWAHRNIPPEWLKESPK